MRILLKIEPAKFRKPTPTKYSTPSPVLLIITRITLFFSKIDPFLTTPRTSNKTTSKGPIATSEKHKMCYKKIKALVLPMTIICLLNKKKIYNSKTTLLCQKIPPLI
jgi:hypothetical protein